MSSPRRRRRRRAGTGPAARAPPAAPERHGEEHKAEVDEGRASRGEPRVSEAHGVEPRRTPPRRRTRRPHRRRRRARLAARPWPRARAPQRAAPAHQRRDGDREEHANDRRRTGRARCRLNSTSRATRAAGSRRARRGRRAGRPAPLDTGSWVHGEVLLDLVAGGDHPPGVRFPRATRDGSTFRRASTVGSGSSVVPSMNWGPPNSSWSRSCDTPPLAAYHASSHRVAIPPVDPPSQSGTVGTRPWASEMTSSGAAPLSRTGWTQQVPWSYRPR